jgi:cytochrome c553
MAYMKLWIILLVGSISTCAQAENSAELFETRVRPVLANNCYSCHTNSNLGGLRVDSRASLLKGGKTGPAIVPGKPEESLLIRAVSQQDPKLKMPMGGKLKDEEIADLAEWVKIGAPWPESSVSPAPVSKGKSVITSEQRAFWAFQPVRKPAPPQVKNTAWPKSPIDNFILAELENRGLKLGKPADKRDLIRRATFDLIGLPPTPEEIDAFLKDSSPDAFARVVDRLLASPHYGERWARYWLDLARYEDEQSEFRYRDWIIDSFNRDLPYDRFVKAQLAADLLPGKDREKMLPALGFLALAPKADDRVDVTARTFLALTAGCAQCHDHKFDPIPTMDFYSLQGVFDSSEPYEYPLAPKEIVETYKKAQQKINEKKEEINQFVSVQADQVGGILLAQSSQYMVAAWKVMRRLQPDAAMAAQETNLHAPTLKRWIAYLSEPSKEHTYLKAWDEMVARGGTEEEAQSLAKKFQDAALAVLREKKEVEDRNYVKMGGAQGMKDKKVRQFTNLEFLSSEKAYLWRDLLEEPYTQCGSKFDGGIVYYGNHVAFYADKIYDYGEHGAMQISQFLTSLWKEHLDRLLLELAALNKASPPAYPYVSGYRDSQHPKDTRIAIRGEKDNPGDIAPRRFLQVLSKPEPAPFSVGSGRLELAEAIANADNPLTARVMVNRIWHYHFGSGIVRTVSNFGQLGERPTHPALLDYLAARFVESGWSSKALHREIMLSSTYALSSENISENLTTDPDNRFHSKANLVQRLDAESLRDSILAVSGNLDPTIGGAPSKFSDDNRRRTIYALISRVKPDRTLAVFDFPDPNSTSEQRAVTLGPLQRLYFLNSNFVSVQSKALAQRLKNEGGDNDRSRIQRAYRLLFGRLPSEEEIAIGLQFLGQGGEQWPKYAQVLLASAEFSSVN